MNTQYPNYLFEVSWEVCNKVSAVHGELSKNAEHLKKMCKNDFFMIGPDVWHDKTYDEFTEDRELYRAWREQADRDGLHFRIGRWNIPGNPIAILVDFTSFFPKKDEIFKKLWETYKLDSISGQWDYIEPAIFGYVSGKIIEHFHTYNAMPNEQILAHFHDWLTGAGVLYIEDKAQQIATVFTAHSTVIGTSIISHNLPLKEDLSQYNVAQL
ncbi:MAG: glycogen/starch synthase, partial [Bacteroidales bacterium]|nr:glycogen/starch synthase [Bacteroidales bacterium]